MTMRMMAAGMLAAVVMGVCAMGSQAAVVVPVKGYDKPNEGVAVKFLNENEQGKKALEKLGLAATELDGMFTPATPAEVLDAGGKPLFSVYTFDGKKLEPQGGKMQLQESSGSLDLAVFFPQVKEGGTFVLVWKDATPLVIETLYNPGRGARELEQYKGQIEGMPPAQKAAALKSFEPTVTHIEPLQYAVISTDKGVIKAKFAYDVAPHTVDNFISLAMQKYYDGSAFHRVISGFMIQGGDSLANMEGKAGSGGPGYQIMQEFSNKLHERGTLSMARSSDPNSAGSQFFVMHAKTPHLDGQYTAFGDVIDGMNVVDDIAKTPVADSNGTVSGPKPKIESIRILPATAEMYGIKK